MRVLRVAILAILVMALSIGSADEIDFTNHPVNEWVRHSPRKGAPIPRWEWEGSGDYDPLHDQWIHHGGHDRGPQGFATFTVQMRTGLWRQRLCNTYPPGVCCVDGSNVFDPANRVFVRLPGASLGHGWQWSRSVRMKGSHVWLYDPAGDRWINMRPPPYAEPANKYSREILGSLNSTGTYDPVHQLAVSFGGQTAGGDTSALHVYDAYSNALFKMEAANRPSRRDGCGLAYDAEHDCLIMFGSQYGNDEKTWIYRYGPNKWEASELDPHPPGRKDRKTYSTIPRMVYDPINKVIVCVVWLGEKAHQTWALDMGAMKWTRMNPAVEPDPSRSRTRNIGFSRRHNLVILESESVAGRQPQVWTYRYRQGPSDPRPAPPTGLKVVTRPGAATLTWTGPKGVKAYNVYRAQADRTWQARFTKTAAVKAAQFEDKPLGAGQVHLYRVAAVGGDGKESRPGLIARTQPRVVIEPVVSILADKRVQVSWKKHPAADVVGYNVYRGLAKVKTVTEGKTGPWRDNDPKYDEPMVVAVRDIAGIRKLNDGPIRGLSFVDAGADLAKLGPESAGYKSKVYAYVVRAVNRLGTESGPSPYALTVPSAPQHVLCRETGKGAELKWAANAEKGVVGYHVYKMVAAGARPQRLTDTPIKVTRFADETRRRSRYFVVAVDALGQEGEPSAPVWFGHLYKGFYGGQWHP